jgi:hypothetical protein
MYVRIRSFMMIVSTYIVLPSLKVAPSVCRKHKETLAENRSIF